LQPGRGRPNIWHHEPPQTVPVLLMVVAAAAMAAGAEPPIVPVGPDAYTMWEQWPAQRIGVRAYMRSTYDRSGLNEWSDASHFLYQLRDDFNVTLDVAGPGVLYFARFNHWHGSPWHFEVDGTDHIVQESSTADPAHPKRDSTFLPNSPFPSPLALTWSQTKGSDLSWVPIGFGRSFRMAYGRTFYGTGYYIYDQFADRSRLSRPVAPWDGKSRPDRKILELLERAGSDLAPQVGSASVRQVSGHLPLPGNGTVTVWDAHTGPTEIRALEFSVPRADAVAFADARLSVTWDSRALPSVDAPVALFYGAGTLFNRDGKEFLVKSLPMVIRFDRDRAYLSCYFPMPFFRSARIQLRAPRKGISDVRWAIRYTPYTGAPNEVGYFHATYRDHTTPQSGRDLVLLDTHEVEGGGPWSGSFVGTSLIFSHAAQLGTLEGNPRFFFDDSQTPQGQGTGTEEWAGGGDYWGGETMTLPLAGHPVGAMSPQSARGELDKIESAYRFLLADLMPFGRSAIIRLEHGGANTSTEHYETVTYWYALPAASLIPTDTLNIGDTASERDHLYSSPQASGPLSVTSRYDGGPDTLAGKEIYPATTDRGRTTKTGSEFTLRIDPRNLGVLLRRKLDYAFPNQRAEVYVSHPADPHFGWQPAGIWYTAGSNTIVGSTGKVKRTFATLLRLDHPSVGDRELGATQHLVETSNRRFREDEFLVPRELTQGQTSVRIRVRFTAVVIPLFPGHPLADLAWSEMRYTAYSFVMPDFKLAGPKH